MFCWSKIVVEFIEKEIMTKLLLNIGNQKFHILMYKYKPTKIKSFLIILFIIMPYFVLNV